jgi:uncharacterized protein YggE
MEKPNTTTILNIVLIVGIVAIALVLALNPGIISKQQTPEQKNTISVTDTGKITVDPDKAEIYAGVLTEGKTAEEAQQLNADKMDKIKAALKNIGVADADMETTNFMVNPKYDWTYSSGKIIGYEASHTLKITTTEINSTGKIADAAVAGGANNINYVNFILSDDMQKLVKNQAIKKAADAAKAKAQALADATGVKLGSITDVSESSYYYNPYRYGGYDMAVSSKAEAAVPTDISPQNIDVEATVTITYEIAT